MGTFLVLNLLTVAMQWFLSPEKRQNRSPTDLIRDIRRGEYEKQVGEVRLKEVGFGYQWKKMIFQHCFA